METIGGGTVWRKLFFFYFFFLFLKESAFTYGYSYINIYSYLLWLCGWHKYIAVYMYTRVNTPKIILQQYCKDWTDLFCRHLLLFKMFCFIQDTCLQMAHNYRALKTSWSFNQNLATTPTVPKMTVDTYVYMAESHPKYCSEGCRLPHYCFMHESCAIHPHDQNTVNSGDFLFVFFFCSQQFCFIIKIRFSVTNFIWSKCAVICYFYFWVTLFPLWLAHSMKCVKKHGIKQWIYLASKQALLFEAAGERTLSLFLLINAKWLSTY